jgi:hypothetical protein
MLIHKLLNKVNKLKEFYLDLMLDEKNPLITKIIIQFIY